MLLPYMHMILLLYFLSHGLMLNSIMVLVSWFPYSSILVSKGVNVKVICQTIFYILHQLQMVPKCEQVLFHFLSQYKFPWLGLLLESIGAQCVLAWPNWFWGFWRIIKYRQFLYWKWNFKYSCQRIYTTWVDSGK